MKNYQNWIGVCQWKGKWEILRKCGLDMVNGNSTGGKYFLLTEDYFPTHALGFLARLYISMCSSNIFFSPHDRSFHIHFSHIKRCWFERNDIFAGKDDRKIIICHGNPINAYFRMNIHNSQLILDEVRPTVIGVLRIWFFYSKCNFWIFLIYLIYYFSIIT